MREATRWVGVMVAAALAAACGGRTALFEPFQEEVSVAGAGGSAGSKSGGQSGAASMGGIFSNGGKMGAGGVPSISGSAGAEQCRLSPSDCATVNEPACQGDRQPCTGVVSSYDVFQSNQYSYIEDVAAARDGRVAVTGFHRGDTHFGPYYFTTDSSPGVPAERAYAASFDTALGVEWVHQDSAPEQSRGVSLAFAPNGETLLQTRHSPPSPTGAGLVRLDPFGQELWRVDFGSSDIEPGAVALDNDGRAWSAGNFSGRLGYPGSALNTNARQGYLLQTGEAGVLLRELLIAPARFATSAAIDLTVDDEDSVLILGEGISDRFEGFLSKLSSSGEPMLAKSFPDALGLRSIVVDSLMRFTVIGAFAGTFVNEGTRFDATGIDLWVAQYSRDGELLWQKSYPGEVRPSAATVDPFGNIIIAAAVQKLVIGGQTLVPEHGTTEAAFVLKLRADGTDVWVQRFDGATFQSAATSSAGLIWLVGHFSQGTWLGDDDLSSPNTTGLLVRLNP